MPVAFIDIVVAHIDASVIIGLAIFVGFHARSTPGAGHVAQRVDGEGGHTRCAATHFVEVVVLSVEHILVVFNEVAVVIDISWHESNPLGGVGRSDHIARVLRVGLPKRQGVVRVAIVGFDGTILGVVPIVDTVNGEAAPSGVGVTDFRVDVGVGSQSHVGNAIGANGDNGIGGAVDGVGEDGLGIGFPVIAGIGVFPNDSSLPGQTIVGGFVHHDVGLEVVSVDHGNIVAVSGDVVGVAAIVGVFTNFGKR